MGKADGETKAKPKVCGTHAVREIVSCRFTHLLGQTESSGHESQDGRKEASVWLHVVLEGEPHQGQRGKPRDDLWSDWQEAW
jgi:hypothetical protein